jgi:hypothetical protein
VLGGASALPGRDSLTVGVAEVTYGRIELFWLFEVADVTADGDALD